MKLARQQELAWQLYKEGLSISRIAEEMNITKQAVSVYIKQAKARITEILINLAEIMDCEILKFDARKAILIGRVRQTREKVYIVYIPESGPCVIYSSAVEKGYCPEKSTCRKVINYYLKRIRRSKKNMKNVLRYIVSKFIEQG